MLRSPPSRRRGLKLAWRHYRKRLKTVASFAEAWIEISFLTTTSRQKLVASFAEAWIEIMQNGWNYVKQQVASFAEAWIEIPKKIT